MRKREKEKFAVCRDAGGGLAAFREPLARELRRGRLTCDGDLFDLRYPPEPERPSWLRGVFGRQA